MLQQLINKSGGEINRSNSIKYILSSVKICSIKNLLGTEAFGNSL